MSLYFKSFTSVYVDTFTAIDLYQFECAKPFDLNVFVFFKTFFYY